MPIRPLPDCIPPRDRRFIFSEDSGIATFDEILADCDEDEVRDAVTTMRVGETKWFGGGAWARTFIVRVN